MDTPATAATSLMVARIVFGRIYNVIVPVIDNGNDNILLRIVIKSRICILLKTDLCHSLLNSQSWIIYFR